MQLAEQEEEERMNDPEYIKEQEQQAKQARILDLMRPKGKGEHPQTAASRDGEELRGDGCNAKGARQSENANAFSSSS